MTRKEFTVCDTGRAIAGTASPSSAYRTPGIKASVLRGGTCGKHGAVERLMAGATMVGIHSEVTYRGFNILTEVIKGIEEFVDRNGYEEVQDIIGKALPCTTDEWKRRWYASL